MGKDNEKKQNNNAISDLNDVIKHKTEKVSNKTDVSIYFSG